MPTQPDLSDDDWAEISAYLDGELDAKRSRAVESRISKDPAMRAEVEALRKTWQMLDYLPQPAASTTFTSRTLEKVSVLRPAVIKAGRPFRIPWAFAACWAAAVLIAGSIGFTGVSLLAPRPQLQSQASPRDTADVDDKLVKDLRVIENKRLYEHVDTIDFLHELDAQELFGDDS
jgi:anti-sigma factor RsiW